MRRQAPLRDHKGRRIRREHVPSCVPPTMRAWVQAQAREYDMSCSWVVAVALSYASGIEVEKPAEMRPKKRRAA